MSTTNTRRYLPAELGLDKNNKPHAFHVEGFIARPAYFKEAADGKKSFLATAIGINMSPAKMMALADGTYSKDVNYGEDSGFLGLKLFGKMAEEFSKICAVGVKVAVSGTLEWRDYTKKDQTPDKELVLNVSNLVVMGGKGVDPVISDNVGYATRTYVKDGVTHAQPMVELASGRVVGCNGLQTKEDTGKKYLTFGVVTKLPAEKIYDLVNGSYNKDKKYDEKKQIVNVSLFDKAAEAMSKVIRDGAEVVVTGPIEAREHEGKVSYRIRARQCSIMKFAPLPEGSDASQAAPAVETAAEAVNTSGFSAIADDDDDGDLPF